MIFRLFTAALKSTRLHPSITFWLQSHSHFPSSRFRPHLPFRPDSSDGRNRVNLLSAPSTLLNISSPILLQPPSVLLYSRYPSSSIKYSYTVRSDRSLVKIPTALTLYFLPQLFWTYPPPSTHNHFLSHQLSQSLTSFSVVVFPPQLHYPFKPENFAHITSQPSSFHTSLLPP